MPTPEPPQRALSATETAETRVSGLPQPDGHRWALYARSGDATARPVRPGYEPKPFDSNEKQLAVLRQIAAVRGGAIAGEYVDVGPAGGPGRAELLRAAVAGECTRILTTDLNRLVRQAGGGEAFLRDLLDCGVGLTVATDPAGELLSGGHDLDKPMVAMAAAILQYEGESERARAAAMRRRRPRA
ncbi:recombinase family protein [Nonomuraea rubra]|uniref:recombinase family protein n=1 Tax=Nonomuraea rubra TaxID=46180 RepID=UPI0033EC94E6